MQLFPGIQLVPTMVPEVRMLDVKAVPGVLVFISTSISTGSVDQVWPKQTEQVKHKALRTEDIIATNARLRITCMSLRISSV